MKTDANNTVMYFYSQYGGLPIKGNVEYEPGCKATDDDPAIPAMASITAFYVSGCTHDLIDLIAPDVLASIERELCIKFENEQS